MLRCSRAHLQQDRIARDQPSTLVLAQHRGIHGGVLHLAQARLTSSEPRLPGQTKRRVAQLPHPTCTRSPRAAAAGSASVMLQRCTHSFMRVRSVERLEEANA